MQAHFSDRIDISNEDLNERAVALFPERLPHAEHNRREWLRSVQHLRSLPGGSKWLLDAKQQRHQTAC